MSFSTLRRKRSFGEWNVLRKKPKTASREIYMNLSKLSRKRSFGEWNVLRKTTKNCDLKQSVGEIACIKKEKEIWQRKRRRLSGVVSLAESQHKAMKDSCCCPLCRKGFDSVEDTNMVLERMEKTIVSYEAALSDSKHEEKIQGYVRRLSSFNEVHLNMEVEKQQCDPEWSDFELRKGMMIALREQKFQSVKLGACVACGFEIDSLADFLCDIDRRLKTMASNLL